MEKIMKCPHLIDLQQYCKSPAWINKYGCNLNVRSESKYKTDFDPCFTFEYKNCLGFKEEFKKEIKCKCKSWENL